MTARVAAALLVLRAVAERRDPTIPVGVGQVADRLGAQLSSVSRLCTELERLDLLERGDAYGSYRLGPAAIRLSGRAAAPFARAVRCGLTLAAQHTGETACLAAAIGPTAPQVGALQVIASVGSAWTLHSPADVGETVDDERGAIVRAAREGVPDTRTRLVESTTGQCVEVAAPVRAADGEHVAVVAIRLPVNRSRRGLPRVRRAVAAARHSIEQSLTVAVRVDRGGTPPTSDGTPPAVEAALRILEHLADGPSDLAETAVATGLRQDRVRRLLDSCVRVGFVQTGGGGFRLSWNVHGWYRAASTPTLVERGKPLVARTADRTGVCAFITVLQGFRSFTVVEELEQAGEGLVMMPWLGRPHPIIGSDGGSTLVMDFTPDEVDQLLGHRHAVEEMDTLKLRMRRVRRDGVVSVESVEEGGLVSVSAPVRDASGSVAAAVCLVGTAQLTRTRVAELEEATRDLASALCGLLTPRR